jgi:xanthine dehydrogenase accessory factor
VVVETNRGHNLGLLIDSGPAAPNTGIPGDIGGYTAERVLRAPAEGLFITDKQIGDLVRKSEVIGNVGTAEVTTHIDGILRGLIRPGSAVRKGLKIGDVTRGGKRVTALRFPRRRGHWAARCWKRYWLCITSEIFLLLVVF